MPSLKTHFLPLKLIQDFLEETPYRRRSFLADYVDGLSVSTHIHESAKRWQINPLVLLTKLQVESSVVFREEAPASFVVDRRWAAGAMMATRTAPHWAWLAKSVVQRDFSEAISTN